MKDGGMVRGFNQAQSEVALANLIHSDLTCLGRYTFNEMAISTQDDQPVSGSFAEAWKANTASLVHSPKTQSSISSSPQLKPKEKRAP